MYYYGCYDGDDYGGDVLVLVEMVGDDVLMIVVRGIHSLSTCATFVQDKHTHY